MFHQFSQATAAFAYIVILTTYIVTGICIAPNQARHKTMSNRRAKMRSCRQSSVSTAENSPATDRAAPTASRNEMHD